MTGTHIAAGPRKVEGLLKSYVEALPGSPGSAWLTTRGIPVEVAQQARVGWSAERAELVFPIFGEGGVRLHMRGNLNDGRSRTFRWEPSGPVDAPFVAQEQSGAFPAVAIVCEGQTDALRLSAAMLEKEALIVAAPGATTWKRGWGDAFGLNDCATIVLPDGDEGGRAFTARVVQDIPHARVVQLPDGCDVCDVLNSHDLGIAWLRDRIEVAREECVKRTDETGPSGDRGDLKGLRLTPLSSIDSAPIQYLWRPYVPLGALTLLEGDPDVGKTSVLVDIVARVTRGKAMPGCDDAMGPPADCLVVAVEDSPARLRARIEAAGADLDRVLLVDFHDSTSPDGRRTMELESGDLLELAQAVGERSAVFVAFDSVMASIPDATDTNKDHKTRRVIQHLSRFAQTVGVAVLAIRHHTKAVGGKAIHRGGGSIAITAVARSVLAVGRDPQSLDRRVLALAKGNEVAESERHSLAFTMVSAEVPGGGNAPRIEWGGRVQLTADDLVAPHLDREERTALDDAKEFLLAELPGAAKLIITRGEDAGISERTLKRAKASLGIRSVKDSSGWQWQRTSQEDGTLGILATNLNASSASPTAEECQEGQGCHPPSPSATANSGSWSNGSVCAYPEHRSSDYLHERTGRKICGICHPSTSPFHGAEVVQ